ncbi:probable ATP-dependent RNA helicase DDX20 [Tribolium castaneum]|uniref:RNA helicase n=1 Tax=Tribolium castaneum TaxID=7070 RepID=D6WDJ8_TRICA|nr:PREDICTED: probable ATP-dependent RNA helicase DDX20 [Tribolium castaneum]EFA00789.1 ATP-dependent RNA helicase WM6-like Protein [Tribolium castaneum]|eukprot:XP_008191111.1 PREDICTED: probable ATP-dependent RNA helicase DDX20 [Tribolium castaneum]
MQPTIAHDLDAKERTKDVILDENISFASLLLPDDIKQGLSVSGFKKPSPIQFKAIPLGRCGFDLIVKSKSGTGKTLVFSTIALETVNTAKDHLQVLILVPTREIAVQIEDVLRSVGCHVNGLKIESFIGGRPLEDDLKKSSKCHIAVGAPGRVKHLLKMGALTTNLVKLFVLDEADKLMEESFQSDINEIYNSLPPRKQMIVSSATYPQELDTFLANYMQSPTHVTSENETPLLLGLKQFAAMLRPGLNSVQQMKIKNDLLITILTKVSFVQCLVFTNYQSRTETVSNYLNQKGWDSVFISAAQKQTERLEAIDNLKKFKNRILLSTDLTSRGIDAPNVDLVINYDLPCDAVTYLHRMGRAGRYGSGGLCINFVSEGPEVTKLQHILGAIGGNLSIAKLPPLEGVDLWQVDLKTLEQIRGVVPSDTSNDVSENLKSEVMELKERKDGKKRKRVNPEASPDLQKEKRKNDFSQDTFCKNRGLLNLTKVLLDPGINIDGDITDSVDNYLKILKVDDLEEEVPVVTPQVEDFMEGIFTAAYDCAIDSGGRRTWTEYLPLEELEKFQNRGKELDVEITNDLEEEEEEEVEEEEEKCEEEEDFEMEEAVHRNDVSLEWAPVVQEGSGKRFDQFFEDCSNVLWQNGLTFETVESFDDWFYHWQESLQSVRNYVQQNIYIEEMSKYQESRRRSNK